MKHLACLVYVVALPVAVVGYGLAVAYVAGRTGVWLVRELWRETREGVRRG